MTSSYVVLYTKGKSKIKVVDSNDINTLTNLSKNCTKYYIKFGLEELFLWKLNNFNELSENKVKELTSKKFSKNDISNMVSLVRMIINQCTLTNPIHKEIFGDNYIELLKAFIRVSNESCVKLSKYINGSKSQRAIYPKLVDNNLLSESVIKKIKTGTVVNNNTTNVEDVKKDNTNVKDSKTNDNNKTKEDIVNDIKVNTVDNKCCINNILAQVNKPIKFNNVRELINKLQNAIYFDSNKKSSSKSATCKVSVRDIDRNTLLPNVVEPFLLDERGDLEILDNGLDNNIGEFIGFYYALKIANKLGVKTVVGDSLTALCHFLSGTEQDYLYKLNNILKDNNLGIKYYSLYSKIKEELECFGDGNILWIKDVINPAD